MCLPAWQGAYAVYGRLMTVAETLNHHEYQAQRRAAKRPLKTFTPNADAEIITQALGKGDEETCKALLAKHFYVKGVWVHP